jgi:hypothetical protein
MPQAIDANSASKATRSAHAIPDQEGDGTENDGKSERLIERHDWLPEWHALNS